MAFTHQETVHNRAGSGTDANVSLSGAPSSGELVVMYVNINGTHTITPDTDGGASWTTAVDEVPSGETARHALFWKIAGGSEPSNMSCTLGSSDLWSIAVTVYSSSTDAEVDSAANTGQTVGSANDIVIVATRSRTVADDALSVVAGGKDNRGSDEAYTTVDDSYGNVVGNAQHQAAALATRVFTTGKTYGASEDVTIETADGNDGASDKPYSVHISFVESTSSTVTDQIPSGSLQLTGFAPAERQRVLDAPPSGSLVLTGIAPLDSTVTPQETITDSVPSGSMVLTGFAPAERQAVIDRIANGALTLTSFAPITSSVNPSGPQTDAIPSGTLTLTSFAPITRQTVRDAVPSAGLALTGVAPLEHQTVIDRIANGNIVITGFAPSTAQRGTIVDSIGPGSIVLTGFAPNAYNPANLIQPQTAGGGPRRTKREQQKKRRWRIRIGQQFYWVSSQGEVDYLLRMHAQHQETILVQEQSKPQTVERKKRIKVLKSNVTRTKSRIEQNKPDLRKEREKEILTLYAMGVL